VFIIIIRILLIIIIIIIISQEIIIGRGLFSLPPPSVWGMCRGWDSVLSGA
jgi:hypothetical protein